MAILLVYYNPHHRNTFFRTSNKFVHDYKVGDINQFGHILIQILMVYNNTLVTVASYQDYSTRYCKYKSSIPIKRRIINKIIRKLDSYR